MLLVSTPPPFAEVRSRAFCPPCPVPCVPSVPLPLPSGPASARARPSPARRTGSPPGRTPRYEISAPNSRSSDGSSGSRSVPVASAEARETAPASGSPRPPPSGRAGAAPRARPAGVRAGVAHPEQAPGQGHHGPGPGRARGSGRLRDVRTGPREDVRRHRVLRGAAPHLGREGGEHRGPVRPRIERARKARHRPEQLLGPVQERRRTAAPPVVRAHGRLQARPADPGAAAAVAQEVLPSRRPAARPPGPCRARSSPCRPRRPRPAAVRAPPRTR